MNKSEHLIEVFNSATADEIYDALILLARQDIEKLYGLRYLVDAAIKKSNQSGSQNGN